jgi:hypothetical protein
MKHLKSYNESTGQKLFIQQGQHNIIDKKFPGYDRERSEIWAEAGNDNGETFRGAFVVQIRGKHAGIYRFEDGKFDKKIK